LGLRAEFTESSVLKFYKKIKVKVKQSHNRPGVAQRVPGGLGSQISMTFGT
jgi:hypothetical protein